MDRMSSMGNEEMFRGGDDEDRRSEAGAAEDGVGLAFR